MDPRSNNGGEFISYPTDRVVGTIEDPEAAQDAADALLAAGFKMDEIDVLYGEEGMRRLSPTGQAYLRAAS